MGRTAIATTPAEADAFQAATREAIDGLAARRDDGSKPAVV
jgi:hypothetical protein